MSEEAQNRYMEARRQMDSAIEEYYEATKGDEVELDDESFASDVIDSVFEATGGKVKFDDWVE